MTNDNDTARPRIRPLAHPETIRTSAIVARREVAGALVAVYQYDCAPRHQGEQGEKFQLLRVTRDGATVVEHPQQHQAQLMLQSGHPLEGRYLYFAEYWESRENAGVLLPYDVHLSRLELPSGQIETHLHSLDTGDGYIGLDVTPDGRRLLVAWRAYDTPRIDVFDADWDEWLSLQWDDPLVRTVSQFRWGASHEWLRCYNRYEERFVETPVDWERRRVLWAPRPAPHEEEELG